MSASTARHRPAPSVGAEARSPFTGAPLAAALMLLVVLAAFAVPVRAERVIELFTSHGCSSCPPADRLLGELIAADPGLVALEFHVDYWNSLVHGGDGNFVDPFSSTAWSLRQRAYDGVSLDGRGGLYTPQAIVDGAFVAVGSDRARIERALASGPLFGTPLAEASSLAEAGAASPLGKAWTGGSPTSGAVSGHGPTLRLARDGEDLLIEVDGVGAGERLTRTAGHLPLPVPDTGEVALVRFLRRTVTPITGGENRGRELVNHRVVTAVETLGRVAADGSLTARVAAPLVAEEGCAVLVRHDAPTAGSKASALSGSAAGPRTRLAGMLCPDPA